MKRESMFGVIAIVAICSVVFIAGCTERHTPKPTPTPTLLIAPLHTTPPIHETTSVVGAHTYPKIPTLKMVNPVHMTQYVDLEDPHFIMWCFFTQTEIGEKGELIDNELEKIEGKNWEDWEDWDQLRIYAKSQYNQIETFLNEMNQFNLTPEMKPSADEYRLYLMDKKNATHHLIKAADNQLSDNQMEWTSNMIEAWDYSISANEHHQHQDFMQLLQLLP